MILWRGPYIYQSMDYLNVPFLRLVSVLISYSRLELQNLIYELYLFLLDHLFSVGRILQKYLDTCYHETFAEVVTI